MPYYIKSKIIKSFPGYNKKASKNSKVEDCE